MPTTFFTVTRTPLKKPPLIMNILAGTMIWTVLIPIAILHIWTWVYQEIYFGIHEIPKVKLKDYMTFDRNSLTSLTLGQKIACCYCAYANGAIAWIKAVINRTEVYSCAIKHRTQKLGQEHQSSFYPYQQFNR